MIDMNWSDFRRLISQPRIVFYLWLGAALIVAGLALSVFAELADELVEGELEIFDTLAFNFLKPYTRVQPYHTIAIILSGAIVLPYILFLLVPAFSYLWFTGNRILAIALVVVPLASAVIVVLLKEIFARDRPAGAILPSVGVYSFPSGHAGIGLVIYGLIGYTAWRLLVGHFWARVFVVIMAVALTVATGLARVYLGVHFLSDVAAGWAAGLAILVGSIVILEVLCKKTEPGV